MKKRIKTIGLIVIVIISAFLALAIIGKNVWNSIVNETHLVLTNPQDYQGREMFFEEEYVGFWSSLLIFPESDLESMDVEKYYYERDYLSLDPIYEIVLEYTLDEKEYQNEKNGWSLLWLLKTEIHRKYPIFQMGFDIRHMWQRMRKGECTNTRW